MKILSTVWFTEMGKRQIIGIVVGENNLGERKAYVGTGEGLNADAEAANIAERGGKLTLEMARDIVQGLTPDKTPSPPPPPPAGTLPPDE